MEPTVFDRIFPGLAGQASAPGRLMIDCNFRPACVMVVRRSAAAEICVGRLADQKAANAMGLLDAAGKRREGRLTRKQGRGWAVGFATAD